MYNVCILYIYVRHCVMMLALCIHIAYYCIVLILLSYEILCYIIYFINTLDLYAYHTNSI